MFPERQHPSTTSSTRIQLSYKERHFCFYNLDSPYKYYTLHRASLPYNILMGTDRVLIRCVAGALYNFVLASCRRKLKCRSTVVELSYARRCKHVFPFTYSLSPTDVLCQWQVLEAKPVLSATGRVLFGRSIHPICFHSLLFHFFLFCFRIAIIFITCFVKHVNKDDQN